MDFKALLNKIDSVQTRPETPAAPKLPETVQLDESASLRVLAGQTSYIAEAKKAKPDFADLDKDGDKKEPMKKAAKEAKVKEGFDALAEPGDKMKTSKGVATKTKTGLTHKSTKDYGGEEEAKDEDDDAPKSKKTKTKESIDTEAFKSKFSAMVEAKKKPSAGLTKKEKSATVKKAKAGEDIGKAGKNFGKVAKAAEKGGAKDGEKVAAAAMWKNKAKKTVKESVEQKLTFKQMVQLVQESGGQQAIDPVDTALFNWAQRVAANKFTESTKVELYAGLIYERNGGVFEMYDVLSEDQK